MSRVRSRSLLITSLFVLLAISPMLQSWPVNSARGQVISSSVPSATLVPSLASDNGISRRPLTLKILMDEKIILSPNDNPSAVLITISTDSPQLGNAFRKMFHVPDTVTAGLPIPVPDAAGQTESQFIHSIVAQQLASLGANANFSQVSILPKTASGGFQTQLRGSLVLGQKIVPGSSLDAWHVAVGLRGSDSSSYGSRQAFDDVIMAQWMLGRLPSDSQYQVIWNTDFQLPKGSVISENPNIDGLSWRIDLGVNSFMSARVVSSKLKAVQLMETIQITSESLNQIADAEALQNGISTYKKFDIVYLMPHQSGMSSLGTSVVVPGDVDPNILINPVFSGGPDLNIPPLSKCVGATSTIGVAVKGCVSGSLHAWAHFDVQPLLYVRFSWCLSDVICLKHFIAQFAMDYELGLQLHASFNATAQYELQGTIWDQDLGSLDFWIGPVPVNIDFILSVDYDIIFSVTGKLTLDYGAVTKKHFSTTIDWCSDLSCQNSEDDLPAVTTISGPTLTGTGLTASIDAKFPISATMALYGGFGPYVSFVPEAIGNVSIDLGNGTGHYDVTLGFKADVGLWFKDGLLKDIACKVGVLSTDSFGNCDNRRSFADFIPFKSLYSASGQFTLASGGLRVSASPLKSMLTGQTAPISGNVTDANGGPLVADISIRMTNTTDGSLYAACPQGNAPWLLCAQPTQSDGTTGAYSVRIYAPYVAQATTLNVTVIAVAVSTGYVGRSSFLFHVRQQDNTIDVTPLVTPASFVDSWTNATQFIVLPPAIKMPNTVASLKLYGMNMSLPYQTISSGTQLGNFTGRAVGNYTISTRTAPPFLPCRTLYDNTTRTTYPIPFDFQPCVGRVHGNVTVTWAIQAGPTGVASTSQYNCDVFLDVTTGQPFACVPVRQIQPCYPFPCHPPPPPPCQTTTFTAEGTYGLECRAVNGDGVAKTSFVVVNIDLTPPVITMTRTPPDGPDGWSKSPVTVTFSCTDNLSGVYFVSPDVTVDSEGFNQTVTGICTDKAGNTSHITVSGINIDHAPVILTLITKPLPNADGWNNQDVEVTATCSDPRSNPVSHVLTFSTGVTSPSSFTCSDQAGYTTTRTYGPIMIDKSPPVLSITSAIDNGINYKQTDLEGGISVASPSLTLSGTAFDTMAGLNTLTVGGTSVSVNQGAWTTDVRLASGMNNIIVRATDKAGNVASITLHIQLTQGQTAILGLQPSAFAGSAISVTAAVAGLLFFIRRRRQVRN